VLATFSVLQNCDLYTAVLTKVVPLKRKSVRDNADWYDGLQEFGVDCLRVTVFTNKEREGINTFVCVVPLYVVERPKASIKDNKPRLPTIHFGIVSYGFVGQPFSKKLYIHSRLGKLGRIWKKKT